MSITQSPVGAGADHCEASSEPSIDELQEEPPEWSDSRDHPVPLRWVVLSALIVAVMRFGFAAHVSRFRLTPDELANGGMARVLAGGQFNMLRTATWQPGLPSLLAPVYLFVDDAELRIRVALVLNAVLAGVAFVLLVRLTERLTPLRGWAVLLTGLIVALLPASMSASAHVWSEPLVSVCFLAHLWAVLRHWDAPTARSAILVVTTALMGYLVHTRLLPLLATGVLVVIVAAAKERRWLRIPATIVGAAGGYYACTTYVRWVFERTWEQPSDVRSASEVASRLALPTSVLDSAIGQIWYLLATTGLVFGFGAVELVRRALRRSSDRADELVSDARLLLVTLVPLIGLSMVFMSDRRRADYFVYGRYNDAVVWPVLAIGLGWLVSTQWQEARRTRLLILGGVGVLLVELGLVVHQLHGHQFETMGAAIDMIAGLTPVTGWEAFIHVLRSTMVFTLVSVGVVAVVVVLRGRQRAALAVLLTVTLAGSVSSYAGFRNLGDAQNWGGARDFAAQVPDSVPTDQPIRVGIMPNVWNPGESAITQTTLALLYQWYTPDREFVLDGPNRTEGDLVVAVDNDVLRLRNGARIIWRHPETRMALWCEPIDPDAATC